MEQRYSDFIRMQADFQPVYDITAERSADSWQSFIPTAQFCRLLSQTLTAMTSNEQSKRRSMWLRGTFGTGKSHASAVIKHLLSAPLDAIENYIESIPDVSLREQLRAVRKQKRFFAVTLKGVEKAYDVPRFKLSLQHATLKALRDAGHTGVIIHSDFAEALKYVDQHENIVQEVIQNDLQLGALAGTMAKLRKRLEDEDNDTYMQLERALHEKQSVVLSQDTISDWLAEVEQELEKRGIANGLIIFWDEFSSVIDTIKSDRINVLQNIAEKSRHTGLFLFLISHRVQVDESRGSDDLSKMKDRFYNVEYTMDEVSTYLIMRHTFQPKDKFAVSVMCYNITKNLGELFDYLCGSNEDERENIKGLFPLHPYTAYLCSRMSRLLQSESASRSVLRFMNDEEYGFRGFINDEYTYEQRVMLTADRLWDFFLPSFEADSRCGTFIATWSSYRERVEKQDMNYLRVFKVVLLLNALGVGLDREGKADKLVPTADNLRLIFADDRWVEPVLESVLQWLDQNNIVNCNVMGEYKISSSNYDPAEVQHEKQKIELEYKTAVRFLEYVDEQKRMLLQMFDAQSTSNRNGTLYRPAEVLLCSAEDNEALMRSMLQKHATKKPNHLHIVIVLALRPDNRDEVMSRLQDFAISISNLIIMLPDETLGEKTTTQFINALTALKVSKIHFNEKDAEENNRQATQHINNWVQRLKNGTYRLYFGDKCYDDGIVQNANRLLNGTIAYKIFPQGFEAVKSYRNGSTDATFFKVGSALALSKQVMEARTRENMLDFKGSNRPCQQVFEFGGNNLVDDVCGMNEVTLKGDSWLAAVCRKVDECMKKARSHYAERFSLSEVLSDFIKAPYGFFQTPACYAALTYALRKHRTDLFIPSTSQVITEDKLEDMIVLLFKLWQDGTSEPNNKLLLRFGSKEESKITELLGQVFNFKNIPGVNPSEVKSLGMAKWGIQEYCKSVVGLPLWTVKYCSDATSTLRQYVDELISLLEMENPTVEKIKAVVPHIDNARVDLHDLLSKKSNFGEGFARFIADIDGVEIEEEWHGELMEELRSKLPPETAFWRETDVENCVLKFYNKKTRPVEHAPKPDGIDYETPQTPIAAGPVKPFKPVLDAKKQAKERVRNAKFENYQWQMILSELIEAHPEIAEYIVNKL